MNHTRRWDVKLAWYILRPIQRICLCSLEHVHAIHDFRITWPCLIVRALATIEKFIEWSVKCTVMNCGFTFRTKKVFVYFWVCLKSYRINSRIRLFHVHFVKYAKLATVVEGDPKAPFSIVTTPRCRGGCYSFSMIDPLYPWSVPYNAEWIASRHEVPFFESLVWLDLGLNPGLRGHLRTP